MLTRRTFLTATAASAIFAYAPRAFAQQTDAAPIAPQPFDFEMLSAEMQTKAKTPYVEREMIGSFLKDLTYDAYRLIRFDPQKARFANIENSRFQLQAFHLGWLFKHPILIFEVENGQAVPMSFGTDDFIYEREARDAIPEHTALPGIAGFRLHHPLNRPDIMDELLAFQGASYFRALGRGSSYGLSARGLAIKTGSSEPEEFPDFTRFYIERPAPGSDVTVIYATLDSPSVTGAYRFVVKPGENTVMETTARLYLREDIEQLGIAPLTSMFLYAERNRQQFDDYRPNVHDSDGLSVERPNGDRLWRPLANPPRLSSSFFDEASPKSFGLYQRDRNFEHFQDASALYERRPSLKVEPIGDWGKGTVRLVEIPTDLEVNDNIIAFWTPEGGGKANDALEFNYRLIWGDLPPSEHEEKAYVYETRAGAGGVSGVKNEDGTRKFIIDFKGGVLSKLPASKIEELKAQCSVVGGEIVVSTLSALPDQNIWRIAMDVEAADEAVVEMTAHIEGYGRKLSESWAYQWVKE